jgi:hypothetical protein
MFVREEFGGTTKKQISPEMTPEVSNKYLSLIFVIVVNFLW